MRKKGRTIKVYVFGPIIFADDTNDYVLVTGEITNTRIIDEIISGKYRGLSPRIIIRKWECSVCHGNFEECPHEIGEKYGKTICHTMAKNLIFDESSIVETPKDSRCKITDLLLIKGRGHKKVYEWYGFRPNRDIDHFKNIQGAYENDLIPERAAFHFGKFFSLDLIGHVTHHS